MKSIFIIVFSILLLTIFSSTFAVEQKQQQSGDINPVTFECDLCELVVGASEYLIKNLSLTQTEVVDELKKVCAFVPKNMTLECDLFMDITAPLVCAALFNGENPETLCEKYKGCPTPTPSPTTTPTPSSKYIQPIFNNQEHSIIKPNQNQNTIQLI